MAGVFVRPWGIVFEWREWDPTKGPSGGFKRCSRKFDTKGEAKDYEAEWRLSHGKVEKKPDLDPNIRFSVLGAFWLEQKESNGIRSNTMRGYRSTIKTLSPHLDRFRFREINTYILEKLLRARLADGYKRLTIRTTIKHLVDIWNTAKQRGIATENEAEGLYKILNLSKGMQQDEDPKAFTADELKRFSLQAKKRKSPFAFLYYVLANTGARINEALALKWDEDIIFADKVHGPHVRIMKTFVRGSGLVPCKTKMSRRIVPIDGGVAQAFKAYRKLQAERAKAAKLPVPVWVFGDDWPETPREQLPRTVQAQVYEDFPLVLAAAELGGHYTPHSLRHTFATILIERGYNVKYVSVLLGHSTSVVTETVYAKWVRMVPNKQAGREIATLTTSPV